MRRGVFATCGAVVASLLVMTSPAFAVSKNVRHVRTLPEGKWATAINFLDYGNKGGDVMLVTGRFGLKSYSLKNPTKPKLLDEITSQDLELTGDPPTDWTVSEPGGDPASTYWQNEDMDVDQNRKLALISRDPRSYKGSTRNDPGQPNPNNATNIAGVYVVDAKDPSDLQLKSFVQLPTGHTTTCINDCQWLWTGGPAATTSQQAAGWRFGRPLIVTDLRDPANPVGHTLDPIDLGRRDGVTAYSHDVQVDDMGIAWVSGDGGTRGYWTNGTHRDPLTGVTREATALNPIPYGGGAMEQSQTADTTGGFEHNAERPVGGNAPSAYRNGDYLLATEEDFADPDKGCSEQGHFIIASLTDSYDGAAWRSTPENPYRLKTVGSWAPFNQEGSRPVGGPYAPGADFCSAHYFDVNGSTVAYAWYGEGTRFLDVSDPANPKQIAYWRPDDTLVWASYFHNGYVYTADHVRGIDVLKLTPGADQARAASQEVQAKAMSAKQRRFLARQAWTLKADPATAGLCFLIQ